MYSNNHLGLWRQVKVILTLLPGHESGVGSSPTLIISSTSSRSSGIIFLLFFSHLCGSQTGHNAANESFMGNLYFCSATTTLHEACNELLEIASGCGFQYESVAVAVMLGGFA
jgi:hypothetical protein